MHDVLVWPNWSYQPETFKTWKAKERFGIGAAAVEFLPYWNNAKLVSSSNPAIKVSLYRKPGKIFIIAANISKKPGKTTLQLNLQNIGSVRKPKKCFDAVTLKAVAPSNGKLNIKLPPRDYQLIIIE